MIFLLVIIVLFIGIIAYVSVSYTHSESKSKRTLKETYPQYSTILRILPSFHSDILGCKDGNVTLLSSRDHCSIGTYKYNSDDEWVVYGDEQYEIGYIRKSSNDYHIYLSLHGLTMKYPHLHSKAASSPHGFFWLPAEALTSPNSIIDRNPCDPIGHYEGDPVEAAAAFICWANYSTGNKYSDFFDL